MGHDLVITNLGNLAIEADAIVVDPYFVSAIGSQHQGCYAQSHYSDLREDFPDMNQMTKKGSGWRNFAENGDLSTMEFAIAILLNEDWQCCSDAIQDTLDIDIDQGIPFLGITLLNRPDRHDACVVDDNIKLAMLLHGRVHDGLHLLLLGDVAAVGLGLAASLDDLADQCIELVFATSRQ